jgi:N-acetylmuramoyl-L-alanine amidase
VSLPGGEKVEWARGGAPEALVLPSAGEGWITFSRRVLGDERQLEELRKRNPSLARPLRDVRVRVPWSLLCEDLKIRAVKSLFPSDVPAAGAWVHFVTAPWGGEPETLWEIAGLFCGDGSRYRELRDANPTLPMFPGPGTPVTIPRNCLAVGLGGLAGPRAVGSPAAASDVPPSGGLGASLAPETAPQREAVDRGGANGALEYLDGAAVYRLRAREALYSAVVVRFTGQLEAAEVNTTAAELAKLSGIADVTDIPIGYPVRIPFDLLLPEYLPANHPRRVEWEKDREELAAIQRVIRAANLDGIHVILDAGHGGGDSGAIVAGVWEATYVYDVMARIKRALERDSKATVWVTVQDSPAGAPRPDQNELPSRCAHRLLVDPPYDLSSSVTGVHLRWVLSNAILTRLGKQKVEPERVVFLSVHADSLHPAVRGLMVYVPGRALRPARVSIPGGLPECREVREARTVRLSPSFRARAEALSNQLGEAIVQSAIRFDVPVHRYEPVRSSIIRGRSRYVPAVLKYNRVPTSVLVEVCNLNNPDDRALLLTWKFREKLAHAIAAGLAEAFSR